MARVDIHSEIVQRIQLYEEEARMNEKAHIANQAAAQALRTILELAQDKEREAGQQEQAQQTKGG